ncbi:MAG: hemolysin family protein, partial [Cyanobacteria bacterium P01_F01_bin.42]
MDIASQLGIIFVLILVNAFFAATEIAVVSLNPIRVTTLVDQGDRRARAIQKITRDSTQFLATIQVGITLAGFFTSATAASQLSTPLSAILVPLVGKAGETVSFILVTLIIAFISLVFGELVPKRIGLRNAEAIALSSVGIISWIERIARPIVRLLSFVTNSVVRLLGGGNEDKDAIIQVEEIKALVEAARVGGTVGTQEERIIQGAVELGELTARAIMVPRVQIQALPLNASMDEALRLASERAHTRLPVTNGGVDKIVGILHAKDLVGVSAQCNENVPTIRELMRPVKFVPELQPVTDLLKQMKENRLHMVIVQDEFGGTAGIVTLEDVLEEIVGEIRDEYDAAETRAFERLSDSSGVFKLRESIATVNHELNVHLPRAGAATLQGLFLEAIDRYPE